MDEEPESSDAPSRPAATDDSERATTDRLDLKLAWLFGSVLAVVFTVVACVRWRITSSRSVDLAYFDQAAWLIQHGKPLFITWRGLPLLADHFSPDIYPMAFAARLVPGGLGLVVLQSVALGLTVVPLWFIARRHGRLTTHGATLVVGVAALYPALWNLMLSGFHPEVVMVPVIVGALLAALDRKWVWFTVAVVLILLAKEDFALIVVGLGIVLLLRGDRRVGLLTVVIGVVWLAVVVGVVMPALNGGTFTQAQRFTQYGANTNDVVRFVALHPWRIFSDLVNARNAALVAALLLPLALTPLRGWRILLAIVPYEWLLLLTNDPAYHLIRYHYTAGATGIILAASAVGAGAVLRRPRAIVPAVMIGAALAGFFWWSELGRALPHRQWRSSAAIESARRDAIRVVPRGAPVAVTEELVDVFSHRQYVYNFPQPFDYWAEPKHTGHTVRDRVDAISWVVVDTNAAWVWPTPRDQWLSQALPKLGFREVFSKAGLLVFER